MLDDPELDLPVKADRKAHAPMSRAQRISDDSDQSAVIAWLADPAAHGGAEVSHVETHISHVFLAGDRVFKLKKAVKLDFLDFSTRALRHRACVAEMAANRAAAGDLYRGVRAIIADHSGGLSFAADQETHLEAEQAVDFVVEMRRFPPDAEFDQMAREGRLERRHILDLADRLAELHAAAEPRPGQGGAAVGEIVAEIRRVMVDAPGAAALAPVVERWAEAATVTARRLASRLEARRRHGYVRRCHGDMHLANICLYEGRPTPFDAIEFSEEIASTDLLYDLAFPAMDLVDHGLPEFSAILISRYLGATRDHSGAGTLPFFASLRAGVRAMTAALRGDMERAGERLALAERLLGPAAPMLLAVGGASGTGKSTLAAGLAPQCGPLGAVMLRSDEIRKRLWGVAPETRLPQEAYGADASARVYGRMLKDARRTLLGGAPAILDAAFLEPERRAEAADLAAELGVPFQGFWLELDLEERRARLAARKGDASDATPELAKAQETRAEAGAGGWMRLDAGQAPEVVVARAAELPASVRRRINQDQNREEVP